MHPYFPRILNSAGSCSGCPLLESCGGLEGEAFGRGCFTLCESHCREHGCDLACLTRPLDFPAMIAEVGGWEPKLNVRILAPDAPSIPAYVPQILHKSKRCRALDRPIVAVPLSAIVGRDSSRRYRVKYSCPLQLRRGLLLRDDCEIIVTSVAPDAFIEEFWANHQAGTILQQIQVLQVLAMTVPNYSFMSDVPRSNSLYNFGRIFRLSERMSEAKIATVLHLQASNRRDWRRWEDLLKDQTHLKHVSLEFQTGAARPDVGDRYFYGLVDLQARLGRALHPLLIAGIGRVCALDKHFPGSYTVIDSMPFLKTMHRQSLFAMPGQKLKWRTVSPGTTELLDERLEGTIKRYEDFYQVDSHEAKHFKLVAA